MLQYKIPQNVGIEDKIVGPFSLRQLIILAIGGGISYVAFAISSKFYELNILEYILIVLPALFSLAMAMLRIHNVSFGKYLLLLMEFAIKPKKRIWDHGGISALVAPDLTDKNAGKKKEVVEEKEQKNVNLHSLSAMLDSGGFEHIQQVKHEDIDEVKDDDLITEAYFGHKQKDKSDNMYWRTRDMQKKKLDLLAKMKPAPATKAEPAPKVEKKEPEKKESVTEHLAKVIKEARKNGEAKKPEVIAEVEPKEVPEKTASLLPPKPAEPSLTTETPKKKRRKRKRKPKTSTEPVRQDTQINTMAKAEPEKLIKKQPNIEGEASFDDLSKGGEIEINLD